MNCGPGILNKKGGTMSEKMISDMSTLGAELHRDIILWRRRTFVWMAATSALAIALCLVAIFG